MKSVAALLSGLAVIPLLAIPAATGPNAYAKIVVHLVPPACCMIVQFLARRDAPVHLVADQSDEPLTAGETPPGRRRARPRPRDSPDWVRPIASP